MKKRIKKKLSKFEADKLTALSKLRIKAGNGTVGWDYSTKYGLNS